MTKEEKDIRINMNDEEETDEINAEDRPFIRRFGKIMLVLFISLLAGCYYIFVVELCIFTVQLLEAKITFLVIFHLLFLLCVWSYLRTVMTPPAVPPAKFRLSESDKQRYLRAFRYCDICQLLKPERCHHCPVCDICILKLDHHCVFLNNCVGFSNYKSFLLCVVYALLLCLFTSAVSLYGSILFWTHQLPNTQSKVPIIVLFSLSTLCCVMLLLLLGIHCHWAVDNITSREGESGTWNERYDLGLSKNLRQVFGDEKKYWFLPVFSSLGDGYTFPMTDATKDIEKNAAAVAKDITESQN
ncbi:hypothetical protein XELAEV_18028067mg [Xenopus laevis]|uniref:Palmitoyltransferase n=1 Tax=Xenopus laevis TaxID=8355 RepID=A0A974CYR6_XENLA|nr:hypothetical protein XELAEV_18028067mg [Xenopus laevis]